MGASAKFAKFTNRLIHEVSPYLQQHAHNPVDWFAWGDEALTLAKETDKPILLSIGYSACHWCHVMERESFENETVAAIMNLNFVNIKVDREERPDLDHIYQLVVQLMGRNGGWPLTVFLTPEQKPFFAGTYFPPVDRYGMPGFSTVLNAVADAYRREHEAVSQQAEELTRAIAQVMRTEQTTNSYVLGQDVLEKAATKLSARFDDQYGGFGTQPKFPNTMSLEILLRRGALENDSRALSRVEKALEAMRAGGIYDQLGGGFHRYSTDAAWLVPHFEKMLYDNALLLRLYVDGYRATKSERYAETVRGIIGYIEREMTSPDGGFFASQDADSEGEEGKFFVWTPAEMDAALGDDEEAARVAKVVFGVTPEGNFEHTGKTILSLHASRETASQVLAIPVHRVNAALERARVRLLAVRESRIKPFRDEKILTSWTALFIGALAEAGGTFKNQEWIDQAERAFSFVAKKLVTRNTVSSGAEHWSIHRLFKDGVAKGAGFLDDYAYLADAALDLYEVTGSPEYVDAARAIAGTLLAQFHEPDGGFHFTAKNGEKLICRTRDLYDQAIPSGMSIACKALLRLGSLVDSTYAAVATRELESIAAAAVENPMGMGQTICALDRLVRGSVDVVLVGTGTPMGDLARAALDVYIPNRNLAQVDPSRKGSREAAALLAEGKASRDVPVAYVCRGQTCSLPISEPEQLREALRAQTAKV